MNLSRHYFAALRLAEIQKRRGFWADGPGRGPQPSISTGVRDYYMTHHWRTVAARGLEQKYFLFPGARATTTPRGLPARGPRFAPTPGYYRSRLRREIYLLLIVNLLKLTPSSKPVPCPLRASETSPLVMA